MIPSPTSACLLKKLGECIPSLREQIQLQVHANIRGTFSHSLTSTEGSHSTFFFIPIRNKALASTSNTNMEPRKSSSTCITQCKYFRSCQNSCDNNGILKYIHTSCSANSRLCKQLIDQQKHTLAKVISNVGS